MFKKVFFCILFLSSLFSFSQDLKEQLNYAESLNGKDDVEMMQIADRILTVLQHENFTDNEELIYQATYLKARVLNRQGHINTALNLLDSISTYNKTPIKSKYFGNLFLLKGIIYKKKANPVLTLQNYSKAIQIFENLNNCKSIVKARNNLANFYNSQSIYNQAIEQYSNCLTLLTDCPNPYHTAIINRNLAGLYFNFEKNTTKGIKHFNAALLQFENLKQSPKIDHLILGVHNELTFLYLQNNDLKKSEIHSELAKKLINNNTPNRLRYNYKLNLAKLLFRLKSNNKGKGLLDQAGSLIATHPSLDIYKVGYLLEVSEYYKNNNDIKKALTSLDEAENLATKQQKTEILSNILSSKSILFEKLGNHKKALHLLNESMTLGRKTFNETNSQIIQNNKYQIENIKKENKYQLEKHQQQEKIQHGIIKQNQLENDKLKILIIAISTIVLLLGVLFWFYSQRKKNSINKLTLESKNKALELELSNKNQEEDYKLFQNTMLAKKEEQNRISRNLHDNIGANLAAIKLALDGEKDEAFSNLIDDVYQEVRNLSYELSESKGLFKQMIHTYLKNIEKASGLEIHFEVFPDVDLEQLFSVKKREVFSIVREVVQNVIKHSNSNRMEIIFSKEDNFFHLYMEDFGCGFDEKEITLGLGLSNIKKRVHLLNGNFHLDARVDRGVIININIPII